MTTKKPPALALTVKQLWELVRSEGYYKTFRFINGLSKGEIYVETPYGNPSVPLEEFQREALQALLDQYNDLKATLVVIKTEQEILLDLLRRNLT